MDFLRFIAAAGIVVSHFTEKMDFDAKWKWLYNGDHSFGLFVDLFFIISGFVIAYVYIDRVTDLAGYGAFLRRRFARLIPLHWATLLIFEIMAIAAAAGLATAHTPQVFDQKCFVLNALLLHATGLCGHLSFNGPSWSISAEFFMYAMTPLLFWIARRSRVAVLFGVITSICLLTYFLPHKPWFELSDDGGVLRAFPSFMFGILLFLLRKDLARIPFAAPAAYFFLIAFFIAVYGGLNEGWLLCVLYFVAAMTVAADAKGGVSATIRRLSALG